MEGSLARYVFGGTPGDGTGGIINKRNGRVAASIGEYGQANAGDVRGFDDCMIGFEHGTKSTIGRILVRQCAVDLRRTLAELLQNGHLILWPANWMMVMNAHPTGKLKRPGHSLLRVRYNQKPFSYEGREYEYNNFFRGV